MKNEKTFSGPYTDREIKIEQMDFYESEHNDVKSDFRDN